MKLRKSQITMLIIIGLVVFIAVSLVLYITKLAANKQSQQNVKNVQVASFETQPIKEFVIQCLDKLAKDATIHLGKQGGYIYKSQGGISIDYPSDGEGLFFIKNGDFKVSYNILAPPRGTVRGNNYADAPKYPWDTFPYEDSTSTSENFIGYFGKNTMPPLNSSEGEQSIQLQIEMYIDNNMLDCTNFDIFRNQGLDISINKSKTSVIIGSNDVTINSKIPITISNAKTREFTELSDFSTNINVRLNDIYLFTKDLIENDINNIDFKIDKIENNRNLFKISLIRDVMVKGQGSKDDIVRITDGKSSISGNPFEYVFARRNRAPALYCVRKDNVCNFDATVFVFEDDRQITESDLHFDSSQREAADPDEDELEFIITDFDDKIQNPLPKLDRPEIKFKLQVSDGKLTDYQIISVKKIN